MCNVKVVTFEVPSLWGPGAQTPAQAAARALSQMRAHALRDGFWTIAPLPRPCRDTRPDRATVSLIGADRPQEMGRTVTIELAVDCGTLEEAIGMAYAQVHDATHGPWDFVVKYAGLSHAVAIAVTVGAPAAVALEPELATS